MLKSIEFANYKILKKASLPLGRFTLIVGSNSSGKSTALQALDTVAYPVSEWHREGETYKKIVTIDEETASVNRNCQQRITHGILGEFEC